jgi:hypothetical protein
MDAAEARLSSAAIAEVAPCELSALFRSCSR